MIQLQNVLNFEIVRKMEASNLTGREEVESIVQTSQALTPRLESNAHIVVPLDIATS